MLIWCEEKSTGGAITAHKVFKSNIWHKHMVLYPKAEDWSYNTTLISPCSLFIWMRSINIWLKINSIATSLVNTVLELLERTQADLSFCYLLTERYLSLPEAQLSLQWYFNNAPMYKIYQLRNISRNTEKLAAKWAKNKPCVKAAFPMMRWEVRPRASVLQTHFLFVEMVPAVSSDEGVGAAGCLGWETAHLLH